MSFEYEGAYNDYMNWIENLTSTLPYHVSVGNHESECHDPACVLRLYYREIMRVHSHLFFICMPQIQRIRQISFELHGIQQSMAHALSRERGGVEHVVQVRVLIVAVSYSLSSN